MKYELRAKLISLGFLQNHQMVKVCDHYEYCTKCATHTGEPAEACDPTLSELIEACGDKFFNLLRYKSQIDKPELIWRAYDIENNMQRGPTPEEAVANLWLKLKENQ